MKAFVVLHGDAEVVGARLTRSAADLLAALNPGAKVVSVRADKS